METSAAVGSGGPLTSGLIQTNSVESLLNSSASSPVQGQVYDRSTENNSGESSDNQAGRDVGSALVETGKPKESSSLEIVLAELKDIKQQISKLDRIDKSTGALAEQLLGVVNRTSELETAVVTNAARLREYDDELGSIKTTMGKHGKSIADLKSIKEDFSKSKDKAVSDMNRLVTIQKEQVETFHTNSANLSKIIQAEVDQKLAKMERQSQFHFLQNQAFNSRNNLIVSGLAEDPNKDTVALVKDFFVNSLKISRVEIITAYRLGTAPADPTTFYARPILVTFSSLDQRNRVWKKRVTITGETDDQKVRIHADLPKQLRDDVQALYKVAKAAAISNKYSSVRVHDYQLEIDDQVFLPSELELLPFDLRPSTLAMPRSDSALAFFTKYAFFSNHHPSIFVIKGQRFQTMEQFLAVRPSTLSGQQALIDRAKKATDPVQAKYILSALRQDHIQEWDQCIESVVMEGLEAKFRQNPPLKKFLLSTNNLMLGEASTIPRWGVGMGLDDKNLLDVSKWNPTGNLLGRALMNIRSMLAEEFANQSR